MGIRSKMKGMIMRSGHYQKDCADFLGYQPETFSSKMRENKYSLQDLIKIGQYTGNRLVYIDKHNDIVVELSLKDLDEDTALYSSRKNK